MCCAAAVFACFVLCALTLLSLRAGDWPQWAGSDAKNMVSPEKGLPETFVPGEKTTNGTIDLATARNVRWGVRVGNAIYSTPSIAEGEIFVGAMEQKKRPPGLPRRGHGKATLEMDGAAEEIPA